MKWTIEYGDRENHYQVTDGTTIFTAQTESDAKYLANLLNMRP